MLTPNIDPIIFHLGPLQVRWYGLMYVIGFLLAGRLFTKLSKDNFFKIPVEQVDLYLTYQLVGMFFGARLVYVFIYNWDYYSQHLIELLSVWQGGLSFHGAIIGFVIANIVFAHKYRLPFFHLTDNLALSGTQGLFFGRIGNFINSELYGRVTDVPWGMVFKGGGPYTRHPSQLYEAVAEGIILMAILWGLKPVAKYRGVLSATFLIGYGSLRFVVEFFREPDVQLGLFLFGTTSMGQILCLIMILCGLAILCYSLKKKYPIVPSSHK